MFFKCSHRGERGDSAEEESENVWSLSLWHVVVSVSVFSMLGHVVPWASEGCLLPLIGSVRVSN